MPYLGARIAPLISYASPAGSHMGAVVETTEIGFNVHDPDLLFNVSSGINLIETHIYSCLG